VLRRPRGLKLIASLGAAGIILHLSLKDSVTAGAIAASEIFLALYSDGRCEIETHERPRSGLEVYILKILFKLLYGMAYW